MNSCLPILLVSVLFMIAGCKQEYKPPALDANAGLLVVDGFLNNSSDTTFIRLSRTRRLEDGLKNSGESDAFLQVEDIDGNAAYSFSPLNNQGNYFVAGMNLNAATKYRLRISTRNGGQYLTDALSVMNTPAIDSVSWKRESGGVNFYVTTHDRQNDTRYYRWEYTETWEYESTYYTPIKYQNNQLVRRLIPDEQVLTCWGTRPSTDLFLGSSAKLSQDIISEMFFHFIQENSIEVSRRYSIIVRQFALNEAAFNYWYNLRQVTEKMGSFFDPQPTNQLNGNIRNLANSSEPVLGFITVSTVSTKRIFINAVDVLPWHFSIDCLGMTFVPKDSFDFYFGQNTEFTPIQAEYDRVGNIIGALAGTSLCTDCTTRGGSNKKPVFW